MNNYDRNEEIDQLLRQMRPMKAPPELKNNILDQIKAEELQSTVKGTLTTEKLLLGLSLLAAMVALLFMVDLGFIASGFTGAISWMNTLLSSDKPAFDKIAETTSQLPSMALILLAAIGLLLLLERLISRKFTNVNYFV